ncbi:MAG: hypothetical protein ACHQD9_09365, partial [Chitinophagales bacterium]
MDPQQILKADFDDLVFENRNKSYGAYDLRMKYQRHVFTALLIALIVYLLGFSMPDILEALRPSVAPNATKIIKVTELSEPPPIDKNTPPPPPPDLPPPPPKTVKFTPPVIKPDEEVKPEDVPPPVADIKEAEPAPVTDANVQYDFSAPQTTVVEEAKPTIF